MKQYFLQTERTGLRFPDENDIPAFVLYLNEPEVVYQLREIPQPYTEDSGRNFLEMTTKSRLSGTSLNLAIEYKKSGEFMGMIGAKFHSPDKKLIEVGYWLGKPFWGKGIMSETIEMFLWFLREEYKPDLIFAYVYGGNYASFSVLEKQGFTNKGLAENQFCNSWNKNPVYIFEKSFENVSRETL